MSGGSWTFGGLNSTRGETRLLWPPWAGVSLGANRSRHSALLRRTVGLPTLGMARVWPGSVPAQWWSALGLWAEYP